MTRMSILDKLRKDKKILAIILSALVLCLFCVVFAIINIPGVSAATMSSGGSGIYIINSNNTDQTIDVGNGSTITIQQDDPSVMYTNTHIVINYTGTGNGTAKVILDGVNISTDTSALVFQCGTKDIKPQLELEVKGTNKIAGTSVVNPLIAVENVEYELYELTSYNGIDGLDNIDNYIRTSRVSSGCSLKIIPSEADTSGKGVARLLLTTAQGTNAAAIGSSDKNTSAGSIQAMVEADQNANGATVEISRSNIISALKNQYGIEPNQSGTGFFFHYYLKNGAQTSCSSGDITIGYKASETTNPKHALEVEIVNNGRGSAIGAGYGADAGKITINNAEIYVRLAGSGLAFGSTGGNATGLEINGGSINVMDAGGSTIQNESKKYGNLVPYNSLGQRLYFMQGNIDINSKKTELDTAGYEFSPNTFETLVSEDGSDYYDVQVNIVFNGFTFRFNKVIATANANYYKNVYFYLPAVKTTGLTVSDSFGASSSVSYTLKKQSDGTIITPIGTNPLTYKASNGSTVLLSIDTSTINYNLSDITVTYSIDGGGSSMAMLVGDSYPVPVSGDNVAVYVTYGGDIPVVYHDGIAQGDSFEHEISLPSDDYTYGGTLALSAAASSDLIFDGWVSRNNGSEQYVTSIDGNNFADLLDSNGDIHLYAKWKIKVAIAIGDGTMARFAEGYTAENTYAYGTTQLRINLPNPENAFILTDGYKFLQWSSNDITLINNVSSYAASPYKNTVVTAEFKRSGYGIYLNTYSLDLSKVNIAVREENNNNDLLLKTDGVYRETVIDGKNYYYTGIVEDGKNIIVEIAPKQGCSITGGGDDYTISVRGAEATVDNRNGNLCISFTMPEQEVYAGVNVTIRTNEYTITFMDGKDADTDKDPAVNKIWGEYEFKYTIDDMDKSIGDIIRRGTGSSATDEDLKNSINNISSNSRFYVFKGFVGNILQTSPVVEPLDTTISELMNDCGLSLGNLTVYASWQEADRYRVNISLFEKVKDENGNYVLQDSRYVAAKLYYDTNGVKTPIYTEDVYNPATGTTDTYAYAKAGDRIYIGLYEVDGQGNVMDTEITSGFTVSNNDFYYNYTSKTGDVMTGTPQISRPVFTIQDNVMANSQINIHLAYELKQFNITYWDLRGYDNSNNPKTYTVFDTFEFENIADGVDWLLVCPDEDDQNDDEVRTETIYGIARGGKPVTDGTAGNKTKLTNLVLMPKWDAYVQGNYNIQEFENEFGSVKLLYPVGRDSYSQNETIMVQVRAKDGYRLKPDSLTYMESRVNYSVDRAMARALRAINMLDDGSDDLIHTVLMPVDEENGYYIFSMPAKNISLVAEFELCQYNITYTDITEDVINTNPVTYTVESDITLLPAEKEGYTFIGWFDPDGNQVTNIRERTGDIELVPKFEKIEDPSSPEENPDPGNDTDNGGENSGTNGENNTDTKPGNSTINSTIRPVSSSSADRFLGSQSGHSGTTGDTTDVARLFLIIAATLIVVMIFVIKRPEEEKED